MFHNIIGLLILLMVLPPFPGGGHAQSEETALVPSRIHNSVYEVIVPKPSEESVTYEKPLPLDLLPFIIRNDKYYSIGTAFAVSPTHFITAAHVMGLGVRSQFKEIFIRDTHGNIFHIDKIVKFSSRRDFAVFTVQGRLSSDHLDLNPDSQVNEKVYAVGNALGQGIIIRDGLYTSNTPEEIDGKWKWIRFSAAASPGNSGGPLLDQRGRVIGVIIGKSASENLNTALPILEVQKGDDQNAEIYRKGTYRLDIFDSVKSGTLDTKIKLPMAYGEFRNIFVEIMNGYNNKLLNELISENRENLFPNGEGSKRLLHKTSTSEVPQLIKKRPDGNWDTIPPQKLDRSELGNNGYLLFGLINETTFLKIQKPDPVSLKDFYSDSKLFMNLLLKGLPFSRMVGPEKIRIVSLGKAYQDYIHTDSYGRKWLVKTWLVPYSDHVVVTFSLPVPGGSVTMMRLDQTGVALDEDIPDLKILADFIYLSFDGTFKQWRDYLEMKQFTPSLFDQIQLTADPRHFKYHSKRFKISSDSDVVPLTDQSLLTLGFGYDKTGDSVVWDVVKLYLNEDRFRYNGFTITRNMRPAEDSGDKDLNHWKRLSESSKPYDMKTFLIQDNTAIGTVYKNISPGKTSNQVSALYDILYIKSGIADQNDMESSLNRFVKNLIILEN